MCSHNGSNSEKRGNYSEEEKVGLKEKRLVRNLIFHKRIMINYFKIAPNMKFYSGKQTQPLKIYTRIVYYS